MILERHPELRCLSAAEKLALVSELWDDLATHPEAVPVTAEQIAELDRRMERYRADPTQDALVLPPAQRIALAHRLLDSVEGDFDPEAEAAWEEEITRRIAQAEAGEVVPVPATEVFARLRRIAPDQP